MQYKLISPANDCNHIHIVFIPKALQLMVSVVAMNEIETIETRTYEKWNFPREKRGKAIRWTLLHSVEKDEVVQIIVGILGEY